MRRSPECSVLIASHGPATYLRHVLDALEAQTQSDFEVVLVDNNRRPQLAAVGRGSLAYHLRIVHEPRVGLSRARNLAVSHSSAKHVAFLDDDAVPTPFWLENLLSGLTEHDVAVAGGAIELGFWGVVPKWLGAEHRRLLAELLYDGADIPAIGKTQYICGGNMAATTQTFELVGGFAESFGRVGRMLRSSEELEWCQRVKARGLGVAFVASARVVHQIGPARLSMAFLLRRGYWQGRSDALLDYRHGRPTEFGPRSNQRNIVELLRRGKGLVCARGPRARAAGALALVRELGFCLEYAELRIRRP